MSAIYLPTGRPQETINFASILQSQVVTEREGISVARLATTRPSSAIEFVLSENPHMNFTTPIQFEIRPQLALIWPKRYSSCPPCRLWQVDLSYPVDLVGKAINRDEHKDSRVGSKHELDPSYTFRINFTVNACFHRPHCVRPGHTKPTG